MVFDGIDEAYENEFADKCEMLSLYGKSSARTTLDEEWDEDELRDNVYDVCVELMTDKFLKAYQFKAMQDTNLLKHDYMTEHLLEQIDVIELYNKEYDKHRHENAFGITWFDMAIKELIRKKLKENLMA